MKQRFTLIDLFAILAILFALVLIVASAHSKSKRPAQRIVCVSNLKSVNLAFSIFATDNRGLFPAQTLSNHTAVARLDASTHFAMIKYEVSSPKLLHCPQDTQRTPAKDFVAFSPLNISYFASLSASKGSPQLWLAGDRNLIINREPARPGQLTVYRTNQAAWTREIHNGKGYVTLVDGSLHDFNTRRLNHSLGNSSTTNLLLFP